MAKRKGKKLTQRKGTSKKPTQSSKSTPSVTQPEGYIPPFKKMKSNSQTSTDVSNAPQPVSLDVAMASTPQSHVQRINILQNIVIVPARHVRDAPKISKNGKNIISFYKTPISDTIQTDCPYKVSKPRSFIQHAVRLIVDHTDRTFQILNELSLLKETPLILKMVKMYPSTRADLLEAGPSLIDAIRSQEKMSTVVSKQIPSELTVLSGTHVNVQVMVHHNADSQVAAQQQIPPRSNRAVRLSPQQLDAIMIDPIEVIDNSIVINEPGQGIADLDQLFIDHLENEERLNEQNRARAAIQDQWRTIADVQHQVNHLRDVNQTYLRAADRILRDDGPSYLGPLTNMCTYCSALYFRPEFKRKYTKCCREGKVALPPLRQMPPLLINLFRGLHPDSTNFKRNLLKYNYAFQFISLEANLRQLPVGRAPPVYAIQGKIYHHLSDVNVNDRRQRFGPIYFLSPEEAINRRNQNNNDLNLNTIESVENLLRNVNPYAQAYIHLRHRYDFEVQRIERLREDAAIMDAAVPLQMPMVTLELLTVRGAHNRQYDMPAIPEVAAVYNADPDNPPTPNLKVYVRDNPTTFRNVTQENEVLDPMVFPLLFPLGDPGWYMRMPHARGVRHVSLCEYYAYRLAIRDGEQRFQYGGLLTQQYIVSAYTRIEANNLNFIRRNQDKLRADHYVGLADYLNRRIRDDDEAATLGRMVILPSTFIGSPRHQQQLFQDAMCVVTRYGTPSLFITMTTNPKWREITENIPIGTQASDHPMLIARVFYAKAEAFMNEILTKHIFGVAVAALYVYEFQKRGLPHLHLVLILENNDRLVDPERVDLLINAEIPDPILEPALHAIVIKNMVHGPCGNINPNSPCMVDGKCSKRYPKTFSRETIVDESGTMIYRRRDNGRTLRVIINGMEHALDNRWIVPYNPYALLKYNCHINVEACATVKCVKYLYSYFFKGVDRALVRVAVDFPGQYDETETFQNGRYMTATEASWHILQLPLHKNTHYVERLSVHLRDMQVVRFQPGFEVQALQRNEVTKLTGWFLLNVNDEEANQYLYTEIPYHYTWSKANRRWTRRVQRGDKLVVRIFSISVRRQELYYLRLLLLHVRGARSYEDVRTVAGIVCDTFMEACQRRNLLADDAEWIRALEEAAQRDMPSQLRQMFAYMLLFCEMSDKQALLIRFLDSFTEDFTRRDIPQQEAIRLALTAIQDTLILHGTRLSQFGLPEPVYVAPSYEIIDFDAERLQGEELRNQLNPRQTAVFQSVMDSVHSDDVNADRLFLINSAAGTGKSYLFQTIITVLRGEQISVVVLAPTGLAASLLKGGRTLHSRFKIPLDINETTTSGVTPTSADGRLIAQSKLIIIDEISMLNKTIFNLVERALRDICDNNQPFANKTVLIAGDFRQILPVLPKAERSMIVDSSIKGSRHFSLFARHDLHVNIRAGENEEIFSHWLLQLGDGTLPSFRRSFYGNIIKLPSECIVNSKQALIDFCFSDLHIDVVPSAALLTPLNATCQDVNEIILDKLNGPTKTYYSADSVDITDDPAAEVANYTIEHMNSLNPSGLPPHRLVLKIGAVIMLLRNLNLKRGLCNGTRLLIRLLGTRYIDAEIININGILSGERVFIPRMDLSPGTNVLGFKLKRRQFPVKLSYVLTINKAQGLTFDKVGIYLPQPVFAHGQLYVAFSRARNFQSVRVFVENSSIQGQLDPSTEEVYTRNIVYREAL